MFERQVLRMSESAKKNIKTIIMVVLFVVFVALVIIGQRSIGAPGLLLMLAGVAGLVAMLWMYNRKYK